MLHRVHRTDMCILWLLFCIYASHTIQPCVTKTSPCGYHMEAYASIMQYTYCHPCNITKRNQHAATLHPPKNKKHQPKKINSKQTPTHLRVFVRFLGPGSLSDEAPMTFLRSSGLMDPEPSASKRLKADKTASWKPTGTGGEDGWIWMGWVRLVGKMGWEDGWSLSGWLGRWLVG